MFEIIGKALLILTAIGATVTATFCVNQCIENTKVWRTAVQLRLETTFNFRIDVAQAYMDQYYPLLRYSFLEEHPHADIAAHRIFWDIQHDLTRSHFNARGVPYHLLTPDNFGSVCIEA